MQGRRPSAAIVTVNPLKPKLTKIPPVNAPFTMIAKIGMRDTPICAARIRAGGCPGRSL